MTGHPAKISWRTHPSWLESTDLLRLVGLSLLVGIGGGLGAVGFRWLITHFRILFHGGLSPEAEVTVVAAPAVGGFLVGWLVHYLAREAKGHGVPEVMLAVALKGGRIRGRVALVKALASAICIGSGGSAGREGPIVQIGATLGSLAGQVLRLSEERIRLLVACGSAAGIAATFNAPVAGVFFALEVILSEFRVRSFAVVVLSSVTASTVGRAILGNIPAFATPRHQMVHPGELALYALLGVLAALVAQLYVRTLYAVEEGFEALRFSPPLKPALGGLMVGFLALQFPQVMGVGYESIEAVLNGRMELALMGSLVVAKIAATSLTLGSGGSGGVFAPALFIGSMLGGTFGSLVNGWLPQMTGPSGGYALVGMAALFAAASHAPITAILILFELTNDYRIILPLMCATVVSTLVSLVLNRESIYTIKLRKRGIDLKAQGGENGGGNPMLLITVGEAMCTDYQTVPPDMPLPALVSLFNRTGRQGFPVADAGGRLRGMVTLKDLEYARLRGESLGEERRVADLAHLNSRFLLPGDSLHHALRQMANLGVGRLPVVDGIRTRRLVGVLRRSDIIRAYNRALEDIEPRGVGEPLRVGSLTGTDFIELMLPGDSPLIGLRVSELSLPADALLVSIKRGGELLIPHGDTVLQAEDVIVAFSRSGDVAKLRRYLLAHRGPGEEATSRP